MWIIQNGEIEPFHPSQVMGISLILLCGSMNQKLRSDKCLLYGTNVTMVIDLNL